MHRTILHTDDHLCLVIKKKKIPPFFVDFSPRSDRMSKDLVSEKKSNSSSNMLDETQLSYMSEECIVVDSTDKILGHQDKKTCHLAANILKDNLLHRAFSVFLFNSKGELLLQQRASEKITFPDCWTNTCCSHPLYTQDQAEVDGILGAKRAARRKLFHELGISESEIELDDLHFITRIHYKAIQGGEIWGEHEIDYIFFLQKDLKYNLNVNEVRDVQYVTEQKLRDLLQQAKESRDLKITISPWFALICEKFFFDWWKKLDQIVIAKDQNDTIIHQLGQH